MLTGTGLTRTGLKRSGGDLGRVFGGLCLLYICFVFFSQMSLVIDPSYLHELHRRLFTYHQVYDAELFAGDYLAAVVNDRSQPYLYDGITRLWAWAGGELALLHRVLPVVCWLAFLAGLAVAARRVGDWVTMLGAVGIAVAQPVYLHQINAATAHSFGFPLLIWGIVAALYGSRRGLVGVTVLSGLLYTAMTPLLGLLLAWHVLVSQRFFTAARSERLRSGLLLALTGAVSLWLVYGTLAGSAGHGAALAPLEQAELYPENGPEGRYFSSVFNPLMFVVGRAITQLQFADVIAAALVVLGYALVVLYGLSALPKGDARKALLGFVACATLLGLAVYLLKPFHVYRYVLYPAYTVLPLLFMVGAQRLGERLQPVFRAPQLFALGLMAMLVLASDSLNPRKLGYWWHLGAEEQALMRFVSDTQPSTLFAVWPGGLTPLELIPYAGQRPLLVMRKVHYTVYPDHILAMRARTFALIDAYFATDVAALRRLHCDWNVRYLVTYNEHFAPDAAMPEYFAPFDQRIAGIWAAHRPEDFLLRRPDPHWVVLDNEKYRVVDLAILSGTAGGDPCGSSSQP
ncbi:MAG TPA: hypothetical protein EYP07_08075 [Kiloniellaceae bacterium]|nr:hypothetical protein [Kiloniellaceae bacterium]